MGPELAMNASTMKTEKDTQIMRPPTGRWALTICTNVCSQYVSQKRRTKSQRKLNPSPFPGSCISSISKRVDRSLVSLAIVINGSQLLAGVKGLNELNPDHLLE
jgi:hypothetical protein